MPPEGGSFLASACVQCHGQDARGVRGKGSDLTAASKRLSCTDPGLLVFLKIGHPRLPNGPTDQDWRDLIAYIRSIRPQ